VIIILHVIVGNKRTLFNVLVFERSEPFQSRLKQIPRGMQAVLCDIEGMGYRGNVDGEEDEGS